jgi:hypothetical protein
LLHFAEPLAAEVLPVNKRTGAVPDAKLFGPGGIVGRG